MKSITYNQSSAKSILLAAVFFGKYPEAKVKTSEAKGTDFDSKLEEEGLKPGYAYGILRDEPETDKAVALEHGIVSNYNDIENFENLMILRRLFEGDKTLFSKITSEGQSVVNYRKSPAYKIHSSEETLIEEEESLEDDDSVEGPVDDTTKPADEGAAESSDVKE